ncbi:PREDICTED: trifunctional purine biosynthetic protein adenosine-3 [Ceratosolen solmsi marchali]|uniref:Trifunctional purine biosynthetic protein adenosine-3 n=1 Tax=Ceratosolen solmsi marchali TaxID=326594 RepID=A0AAJ6YS61_9HYME|nr:PREDICTED: trifunctional purine biosynthetic protein adenosine-3 [Ceratosolen solmsi marchali]
MTIRQSVLVIGSGGREHAICWKLAQSEYVEHIYVAPGNSGMVHENNVKLITLDVTDNEKICDWCKKNSISMVVIGPEDYLAQGLANHLNKINILCFGPQKEAAKIESDKIWSKKFMNRHNIPTAKWRGFRDSEEAKKFVQEASFNALVIKASGLAAGKGVIIAKNNEEAYEVIDEILNNKKFGSAGSAIVVEELLEGEEVSMLAFTDGKTVVSMPPAQDHKRIFDGDLGLNTGGMGAYCPCSLLTQKEFKEIEKQILQKTIDALRKENIPFIGVLYAGLILTSEGPKVLEFNCRFGDPETQVILPLLKSDLYTIMKSCCEGNLSLENISWREDIFATGVILASRNYPKSSSKGEIITGIEEVIYRNNHYVFHSGTSKLSHRELLTNGGRVLITVAVASSLALSTVQATAAARHIKFDGKQFRTDIAHKGIPRSILQHGQITYKNSGVDIESGNFFISHIKPLVLSTKRSGTLGNIGDYGGLFDTRAAGYKDPILVSGTDGVGTKLKIAFEYKKHNTIGIDLVAMCVNDVLVHGAEPLFFLDYFTCGYLNIETATEVINGIVEGCKRAGCSLIGGETSEMPEMYKHGEYDLAGFAVGAVERSNLLPKFDEIKSNDIIIGLPSSGIHSNGFSLIRKILKMINKQYSDIAPFSKTGRTIGEELLVPTKIYSKALLSVLKLQLIKGFAHITGGGLIENIPRILPNGVGAMLDATKWNILPIFGWLAIVGDVKKYEMLRTFNCGIGGIIICSLENKNNVMDLLKLENPVVIGNINSLKGSQQIVEVKFFEKSIEFEMKKYVQPLIENISKPLKKVGVLISGIGTNLQALIDATRDPVQHIGAEIVLVISSKDNVEGLKRAKRAGIINKVIKHTDFINREAFDREIDKELVKAGVEIVCLAGFMRILSSEFVAKWRGAIINIHPSLLPSFKGVNAHKDVLKFGARISGCTVHFVMAEVDSGTIIEQESVPVFPSDTVQTLEKRIKIVEHKAFPRALKYLATEKIRLREDNSLEWKN